MTDAGPDTETLVQIHESRLDALNDTVERLENLVDEQAERIAELETLVDPDPGSTPYEQLTKDQKVNQVRGHLVNVADASNGKASLQYREIKTLFNGHPSPGHCYDLMRAAATIDGFQYDSNGNGNKRIRVNTGAVKDDACFHAANKARDEKALSDGGQNTARQ